MLSQSSFVVPHSVKRRARYPRVPSDFELFDHDNQMPIDWLKSPINELSWKVMRSCPTTRASVNDIITGNDIYVVATHTNVIDFMNLQYNDIELIDYVKTPHTSARAWHSQNIIKDGMMWRSIVSVLNN